MNILTPMEEGAALYIVYTPNNSRDHDAHQLYYIDSADKILLDEPNRMLIIDEGLQKDLVIYGWRCYPYGKKIWSIAIPLAACMLHYVTEAPDWAKQTKEQAELRGRRKELLWISKDTHVCRPLLRWWRLRKRDKRMRKET